MGDYILLVEDDETLADVVQSALRTRGYKVTHAATCANATAVAAQKRPRLLLLDIALPDGNGLDLLSELRANHLTNGAPVIVLSSNQVTRSVIRRLDIQRFIPKPYSVSDLVSVVDSYLKAQDRDHAP